MALLGGNMTVRYPDYSNGNMNISCSLLKYYGCPYRHPSLEVLDKLFETRKPRNVVFMLFDAMGISIINRHLPEDSFIRRHIVRSLTSTFPPTTVAATTAINSGLQPIETGWLGWITYFREVDQNVVTFFNTKQGNEHESLNVPHLAYSNMPYPSLIMQIRAKHPEINVMSFSPFMTFPTDPNTKTVSVTDGCDRIIEMIKEEGPHFIYSYWDNPDHDMHVHGIDAPCITDILKDIDRNLERLSREIGDDTLVIVTADHSQINSKWLYLCDYPELQNLLVRPHSIEFRAASLFVKEGKQEEFKERFEKLLGEHFILMSHKEFLESGLLGNSLPHPRTDGFVGDFVAISKDEYCLGDYHEDSKGLIGIHAGLTEEEMMVPLIVL